ncbi:hypothetical protein BJ138DRAFT_1112133 [Hygrophoropsis aurantiaca]|uniref:Uncharacterized protein n=1 Tax=Hygrophoropsis aurantiaca TaxID=72124 RepID=A0ACB8AH28_9AGAM|nr:hypothetical protein BJ138DRAFT_1112133 [Hygrophoropsis aurantiaca]
MIIPGTFIPLEHTEGGGFDEELEVDQLLDEADEVVDDDKSPEFLDKFRELWNKTCTGEIADEWIQKQTQDCDVCLKRKRICETAPGNIRCVPCARSRAVACPRVRAFQIDRVAAGLGLTKQAVENIARRLKHSRSKARLPASKWVASSAKNAPKTRRKSSPRAASMVIRLPANPRGAAGRAGVPLSAADMGESASAPPSRRGPGRPRKRPTKHVAGSRSPSPEDMFATSPLSAPPPELDQYEIEGSAEVSHNIQEATLTSSNPPSDTQGLPQVSPVVINNESGLSHEESQPANIPSDSISSMTAGPHVHFQIPLRDSSLPPSSSSQISHLPIDNPSLTKSGGENAPTPRGTEAANQENPDPANDVCRLTTSTEDGVTLSRQAVEINALQRDLSGRSAAIDVLESDLSERNAEIISLQRKLSERGAEVITLQRDLSERSIERRSLQRDLYGRNAEIGTLQRNLSDRNVEITILKRNLSERSTETLDLRRKLEAKENENAALQMELEAFSGSAVTRPPSDPLRSATTSNGIVISPNQNATARTSPLPPIGATFAPPHTDTSENSSRRYVALQYIARTLKCALLETDMHTAGRGSRDKLISQAEGYITRLANVEMESMWGLGAPDAVFEGIVGARGLRKAGTSSSTSSGVSIGSNPSISEDGTGAADPAVGVAGPAVGSVESSVENGWGAHANAQEQRQKRKREGGLSSEENRNSKRPGTGILKRISSGAGPSKKSETPPAPPKRIIRITGPRRPDEGRVTGEGTNRVREGTASKPDEGENRQDSDRPQITIAGGSDSWRSELALSAGI